MTPEESNVSKLGDELQEQLLPSPNSITFMPEFILSVDTTKGDSLILKLDEVESFEYCKIKDTLFVYLKSGRQHGLEGRRAKPLFDELTELCSSRTIVVAVEEMAKQKGRPQEPYGGLTMDENGSPQQPNIKPGRMPLIPGLPRPALVQNG